MPLEHSFYWTGYIHLATCRRVANGPIPWDEMENYLDRLGVVDEDDREEATDIWGMVDNEFRRLANESNT